MKEHDTSQYISEDLIAPLDKVREFVQSTAAIKEGVEAGKLNKDFLTISFVKENVLYHVIIFDIDQWKTDMHNMLSVLNMLPVINMLPKGLGLHRSDFYCLWLPANTDIREIGTLENFKTWLNE